MNKKTLLLLALFSVIIITVPFITNAASSIRAVISGLADGLGGLGGAMATIGFIVAGIIYITATTDPKLASLAKAALVSAVIGVVILLLATNAENFIKNLFSNTLT
jgi:uncharacterized membrane protein YhhN